MTSKMRSITVRAPVNIAVIKYWGKVDEQLIIPLNDSISGTLSIDDMCATTTVAVSDQFTQDRMWLNGDEQKISENKRLVNCLKQIRSLSSVEWSQQNIHISSQNNFPTAAGLASSAAGYACLMYALAKLFGIENVEKISTLARIGSGSACRSVYGGFVQWIAGIDSNTSIARQIVDENYWPEMRVLVLVVSDHQKDTSSTSGMQLTVETSSLMRQRVDTIVPKRIEDMIKAIKNRDFNTFAEITMKDSNQLHGICQDTYPPIRYMNDISWSIIRFCHKYNDYYGVNKIAYTFDAGPNACLYLLEDSVGEVLSLVKHLHLPLSKNEDAVKGLKVELNEQLSPKLIEYVKGNQKIQSDSLRYIISTKIGCGPQIISDQSLLNELGLPV